MPFYLAVLSNYSDLTPNKFGFGRYSLPFLIRLRSDQGLASILRLAERLHRRGSAAFCRLLWQDAGPDKPFSPTLPRIRADRRLVNLLFCEEASKSSIEPGAAPSLRCRTILVVRRGLGVARIRYDRHRRPESEVVVPLLLRSGKGHFEIDRRRRVSAGMVTISDSLRSSAAPTRRSSCVSKKTVAP